MDGANAIPQFQFEDHFLTADYGACKEIFASGVFARAMVRISPMSDAELRTRWPARFPPQQVIDLDRTQRAMGRVFASIHEWSFENRVRDEPGGTVHAELDPGTMDIVLYATVCTATRIYSFDIGDLNKGHRYWVIAAHELGHAVDIATGDYDHYTDGRETRATVYGSYVAECSSRAFQNLFGKPFTDSEPAAVARDRLCMVERWKRLEAGFARARERWVRDSSDVPTDFLAAFADKSPGPADGGPR